VYAGGIYRFRTRAENSIGFSYYSEEIKIALARKPEKPVAPIFDTTSSSRFQNVIVW
jgi:hypothetical protein